MGDTKNTFDLPHYQYQPMLWGSFPACDLLPISRTKVMEQSPLISENSGYETIQIYRWADHRLPQTGWRGHVCQGTLCEISWLIATVGFAKKSFYWCLWSVASGVRSFTNKFCNAISLPFSPLRLFCVYSFILFFNPIPKLRLILIWGWFVVCTSCYQCNE